MKLILIFTICLCWSEIYALKCSPLSTCVELMRNDWLDPKHVAIVLMEFEKKFFDGLGISQPATPSDPPPGVRKECRTLSDGERNLLFSAFQWLFTTKPHKFLALLSHYKIFMSQHRHTEAPGAHFGPDFPGWHREFLLRFERALQLYNKTVTLCYWDSSLDSPLPKAADSALWTPEYFGNGQGYVTTGFAANQAAYPLDCTLYGLTLYREVGGNDYLYNERKFNTIFNSAYSFTQLMTPFTNNSFENFHGEVHVFVGGHMLVIDCAALDPVFWLHHTFIDYLWEKFRQIQTTNKEQDYPTDPEVPTNHRANDTMSPFTSKICIDGLSNSYIPSLYSYAPSPSNCTTHGQCGGKALWCNNGTCMACVGLDGQMGTNWPKEACYITDCSNPQNVNQVCKCGP